MSLVYASHPKEFQEFPIIDHASSNSCRQSVSRYQSLHTHLSRPKSGSNLATSGRWISSKPEQLHFLLAHKWELYWKYDLVTLGRRWHQPPMARRRPQWVFPFELNTLVVSGMSTSYWHDIFSSGCPDKLGVLPVRCYCFFSRPDPNFPPQDCPGFQCHCLQLLPPFPHWKLYRRWITNGWMCQIWRKWLEF